jgi:hypothetical protein
MLTRLWAHRTPESVETTLRHVNDALEFIENVLQKYYVLLAGSGLMCGDRFNPGCVAHMSLAVTRSAFSDVGGDAALSSTIS